MLPRVPKDQAGDPRSSALVPERHSRTALSMRARRMRIRKTTTATVPAKLAAASIRSHNAAANRALQSLAADDHRPNPTVVLAHPNERAQQIVTPALARLLADALKRP